MLKSSSTAFAALAALSLAACGAADGPAGPDRVGNRGDGTTNGGSCSEALTGSFENITIPAGATCTIRDAVVSGNIKAMENSRVYVVDTRVGGNIQGDEAAVVQVKGGTVDGDIQIQNGRSSGELGASVTGTTVTGGNIQIEKIRTGRIVVRDAKVLKGDIQLTENTTSTALVVEDNRVEEGNLQVFKNVGAGSRTVRGNSVAQDLQCKENAAPFTGGPNSAGDVEGQCS